MHSNRLADTNVNLPIFDDPHESCGNSKPWSLDPSYEGSAPLFTSAIRLLTAGLAESGSRPLPWHSRTDDHETGMLISISAVTPTDAQKS